MSETTNLQLYKHDNPSTNTEQFDVEKSLNENWDKIDEAYGTNNINIQELQSKVITLEAQNTQLESQIPTGEASGNPIHISDSSDLGCEIVVVGNAEQDGEPTPDAPIEIITVGQNVNIIPTDPSEWEQGTINEGVVEASTTRIRTKNYCLIDVLEHTISMISGQNYVYGNIHYYNSNKTYINNQYILSGDKDKNFTKLTFTPPEGATYFKVVIKKSDDSTILASEISDVKPKLEKGSKAMPYSPYGQGSVEIDVVNKNLLNLKEYFKGEIAYGSSCEGYNVESNYMELMPAGTWSNIDVYISGLKANTDYTISANFLETIASSSIVGFTLMGNSEKSAQGSTGLGNNNGSVSKSVKTFKEFTFNTKDYAYIIIRFYANWSATSITKGNSLVKISEIQLEVGTTATNYTPHESQTAVLPIQKEFVKIGDYEDTFIKQDGKWYEAHYHPKIVADGTNLEWYKAGVITVDRYSTKDFLGKYGGKTLCTHFKYANGTDEIGTMWLSSASAQLYLNFAEYGASTVADLNAWLAEQYANGTPVEIYYELATPELIECTEEQEQILNSFHTYKNITNITASGIANLKVNYKKDLATVINNLSQAIVGGN